MFDRRALTITGLAALLAPTAVFAFLYYFPSYDAALMWRQTHFWGVGATSLAAAIACAVVVASARSLRETRSLLLALAFISIGGIFSIHGLMTPGVMKHEFYASLAVSSWLSVLAGAAFVALSAVQLPAPVDRAVRRMGGMIFAWAVIAIGAYITLSLTVDEWLNSVPTDNRNVQYLIAGTATALIAFGVWRYAQAYLFARLPAQAAMVVALTLLLQVPAILVWGTVWHITWWMYHVLYGAAFVALFTGWALEAKRAGSLHSIADALAMRDALAQLNRGRDTHIIELVEAIEAKDRYTVGHVHRVGTHAFEIGKRLGLSNSQLRDVVLAAQMHDVGKIGVPDQILLKPAKLTDEEFAEMKKHTVRGGDIARRVEALRSIADCVRGHHERFDGGGYPDGLAGEAIPLPSRIVAVADTYDAMTSTRPYRDAQRHEIAIAEIERVRGSQLDPRCVDAFLAFFAEHEHQAA